MYKDYSDLEFERQGPVLSVSLNRPAQLNAIDARMHGELARLFRDLSLDEQVQVVVLTGKGNAFSAGGDFGYLRTMASDPVAWNTCRIEAKQIVFGLLECEKPIIAKVNGPAVGLGATIALFCDMVFAARRAVFADPHVSVGLVAGDGGAIIWPQLIGFARAKEYLMTGKPLTAEHAERIGLINHAVPDDELDERVQAFAMELASGDADSIRYTKTVVNIALRQLAHSLLDASLAYETITNFSDGHRKALQSIQERRTSV